MGRSRNRRPRNRDQKGDRKAGRPKPANDERKPYTKSTMENAVFEKFYQAQGIVPDGEWEEFLAALRRPLPATFRITGFKGQSTELQKFIKGEFFDKLVNIEVEGRAIEPPKCLPWYPGGLAWQLDLDRKTIRHCEPLKKLHNFLVEETESGNISRQEGVSMIPPVVMGIEQHHKVLDMCAAPGSKTAQLIEMLHSNATSVPDGCVVANDSDNKRCYLMTHQVKRLESPNFVIINQDASAMPNFKLPNKEGHMKSVRFDRVLADVPCSGDGTMRKNCDQWIKWNPHTAMHLHNIQSRILGRGLEMLDIGGRLVYSTCSFNPIEDEAVVSNMLRKAEGTVRLVEFASKLSGLKGMSGKSSWKVFSKEMESFDKIEDVPERLTSTIRPSVFPPSEEEVKQFNLQHCMRILPHHQDTGGFFVALMEKVDELPWVKKSKTFGTGRDPRDKPAISQESESEIKTEQTNTTTNESETKTETEKQENGSTELQTNTENLEMITESAFVDKRKRDDEEPEDSPPWKKRKGRYGGFKEDPFVFISEKDPIWPAIQDFFKLKNFPADQLLVRCIEGKKRNVYFASHLVKQLVVHNITRLKFINLGLKMLSRSESAHTKCPYRTVQEGVCVLYPYVTERIIPISKDDIVTLLRTEMPFLSRFSKDLNDTVKGLGQGSVIFLYDPPPPENRPADCPGCRMILCGWLGSTSCRSFIALNERGHYLRLCGAELQDKEERRREQLNFQASRLKAKGLALSGQSLEIKVTDEDESEDKITGLEENQSDMKESGSDEGQLEVKNETGSDEDQSNVTKETVIDEDQLKSEETGSGHEADNKGLEVKSEQSGNEEVNPEKTGPKVDIL